MTFYKECPIGDLSLTSIGESPLKMHFPEYFQEKSLLVAYKVNGCEKRLKIIMETM